MRKTLTSSLAGLATLLSPAIATASPCFDIAVQKYSKQRVVLEAPFNYAQAIRTQGPTENCNINALYLGEYSLKIGCPDGYKYEIGTTEYCGRDGSPNCEKAVVTSPSGNVSYHPVYSLGDEKSCIKDGAQLVITNKILYDGFDILIVSTHQFRTGE
jgi:hypothetical protein